MASIDSNRSSFSSPKAVLTRRLDPGPAVPLPISVIGAGADPGRTSCREPCGWTLARSQSCAVLYAIGIVMSVDRRQRSIRRIASAPWPLIF